MLDGVVRNLTSFGAFVEIESGIDGLVHVSDMSWTRRIEHPSEMVDKADELKVMVLDVDSESKRISLGIKQLSDDPWPQIVERFAPGVEQEGEVVRLQDKGVVVDLGDDIEGFIPHTHSTVDDPERLNEYFHTGDAVDVRVTDSDAADRRITLEVTTAPERKGAPPEPEPSGEGSDGSSSEAADEAPAKKTAETPADATSEAEGEAETEAEATADSDAEDGGDDAPDASAEASEESTDDSEESTDEATTDEAPGDDASAEASDESSDETSEDGEESDPDA